LQLLAYLNVLRPWPAPERTFGVARLAPVGVFYVSLRGKYPSERNRLEALASPEQARRLAYRHTGRFDQSVLGYLDSRPDARQGDQFNYRLTTEGQVHRNAKEALSAAELAALLDSIETNLRRMGGQVYAGVAGVSPYRKGSATACQQCDYRSICRIDPWTHPFRLLKDLGAAGATPR
jgi:ATP-dependent helicase/nuclease subunit B